MSKKESSIQDPGPFRRTPLQSGVQKITILEEQPDLTSADEMLNSISKPHVDPSDFLFLTLKESGIPHIKDVRIVQGKSTPPHAEMSGLLDIPLLLGEQDITLYVPFSKKTVEVLILTDDYISFLRSYGKFLREAVKIALMKERHITDLEAISRDLTLLRHNIRNALTSALYQLDVLIHGEEEEQKPMAQFAHDNILRASNITGQPLPSLEQALERPAVHLGNHSTLPIIQTVAEHFRNCAQISIEARTEDTATIIDPIHFEQIIYNLLENATKFNDTDSPQIKINIMKMNQRVFIVIKDNGPGIPEEEEELVFQMGYRSKTTEHIPGSGEGLSYCKSLTEIMGGRINLGENPNSKGTVIELEF